MKKLFLYYIGLLLFTSSCETVVDIDLEEGSKNLVSQSILEFPIGEEYGKATVELSETSAFFSDVDNPVVSGAHVVVNDLYVLIEQGENTGIYSVDSIPLIEDGTYKLTIEATIDGIEGIWEGSDFFTRLTPTESHVSFEPGQGPHMKDGYFVNVTFSEPGNEENFYLQERVEVRGDSIEGKSQFPDLRPYDDEFVNGHDLDFPINDRPYQLGDSVSFKFSSISESSFLFYENLFQLLYQTIGIGASPPFTLRGNLVSKNENLENAFGNFKVKNVYKRELIIGE